MERELGMDDVVRSENYRWIFWSFGDWPLGFRRDRLGWDLPAMDSGGSGKGAWWTMVMPRGTPMEVTEESGSGRYWEGAMEMVST